MSITSSGYLFYAFLILMLILLVVSIVKKVIKLLIVLLVIVVGFSAYNVVVKGVSPVDEVRGYGVDIQYGRSIGDYSVKVKNSVENIKNLAESSNYDNNTINAIKSENANLHKYESEVLSLKHTSRINLFHDKYCGYLEDIVSSSDALVKIINVSGSKNVKQASEMIQKLNANASQLINLKVQ
ncbi:MAG: hypothetical protein Q8936_07215 [Bacillota bacterium]|nr:hypothetical protein [Bacillota bacterium]